MVSPMDHAAIRDRLQTALRAALRGGTRPPRRRCAWPSPRSVALRPWLAAAPGRILLGSDFPNIPYPYLDQLEALARLDLGAAWLRAVCHENAVRLLGL